MPVCLLVLKISLCLDDAVLQHGIFNSNLERDSWVLLENLSHVCDGPWWIQTVALWSYCRIKKLTILLFNCLSKLFCPLLVLYVMCALGYCGFWAITSSSLCLESFALLLLLPRLLQVGFRVGRDEVWLRPFPIIWIGRRTGLWTVSSEMTKTCSWATAYCWCFSNHFPHEIS